MALDPSIALQVNPNTGAAQGGALALPLQLMQLQAAGNQNQLFRQTFQSRVKAGRIIADSPDMESAIKAMLADPDVAPFAGETINHFRTAQSTLADITGKQADQNRGALSAVIKGSMMGLVDPSQFIPSIQTQLSALPPELRNRVAPTAANFARTVMHDLPSGPEGMSTLKQRLVGALVGAGVDQSALNSIMGTPSIQTMGGHSQAVVLNPAQLGPGMQLGNSVGHSLSPQVTRVPIEGGEGAEQPVIVGGGAGGPAPAGMPSAAAPGPVSPLPPGVGAGAGAGGGGAPLAVPGQAPGAALTPGLRPIGGRTLSEPEKAEIAADQKIATEFQTEFAADARLLPSFVKRLDLLQDALTAAQSGGGAEGRTALAKALQTARNAGFTGITDAMVNKVANGSLPASQIFMSTIKPLMTKQLSTDAAGTGRVMLPEVKAYLESLDFTNDPQALMSMLNQVRTQVQIGYDRANRYREFREQVRDKKLPGVRISDYPNYYNSNMLDVNKLPQVTPGGLALAPRPGDAAVGATGSTERWVYDPEKRGYVRRK